MPFLFLKIVPFEEGLSGCRPPQFMISVIVENFSVYSARLAKVTLKKWFFLGFTWPLRRFLLSRLVPTTKRILSHVQMESNFEPKTQIVEVKFLRSEDNFSECCVLNRPRCCHQ